MTPTTNTSIKFPTVGEAIAYLGHRALGVDIRIVPPAKDSAPTAPTAPQYRMLEEGELILITDEWQHADGDWRIRSIVGPEERLNKSSEGGCHTPHRRLVPASEPNDLEAEAQRLHALWHEAAADAMEQREEVKRLCKMLDHAEGHIKNQHVAAWEKIQEALPPQPMESNLSLCDYVIWHVDQQRKKIKELDASETKYHNYWTDACETIRKVTAERNALHARVARLEVRLEVSRDALVALGKLGSEPNLGNSEGNMVARVALLKIALA